MPRKFNRASVPIGRFVSSPAPRLPMPGHCAFSGPPAPSPVIDRQAELLPLIRAAKAARQIDPFRHLDFPPEAPRAPSLQATHGARSVFATIIGAVRRISGGAL